MQGSCHEHAEMKSVLVKGKNELSGLGAGFVLPHIGQKQ
jgi:hypothetical protein